MNMDLYIYRYIYIYYTAWVQKEIDPITGQIPLDAQAVFRRFPALGGSASGAAEGTGLRWLRLGAFAFLEGWPLAAFNPLSFLPPSPELRLLLFFLPLLPFSTSSFRSLASCLPGICFSQGLILQDLLLRESRDESFDHP